MDWKKVKKIDGHVHILPNNQLKQDDKIWAQADKDIYLSLMAKYNIAKAVTVPTNDQFMYCTTVAETNKYHHELSVEHSQFIPFIDIVNTGGYFYCDMPDVIQDAVDNYHIKGLKIHPSNLGINIDSLDMVPIFRKACDLGLVIMIHSYPYYHNNYDCCRPSRIHNMSKVFPDAKIIVSHMGGHSYNELLAGNQYVDMSAFLPELVELVGSDSANRILRNIGVDKLIFATDYPQVCKAKTEEIYDRYCDILNDMDFADDEIEKIAYKNIAKLLDIQV